MSTETIYRSLFVQTRCVLARELTAQLRTRRTMRRSKQASRKGGGGVIRDGLPISARPLEVADRAVPGHWEGDLLAGYIEHAHRHPGRAPDPLPALVKLDGRDSETVVAALAAQVQTLPVQLRRGVERRKGRDSRESRPFVAHPPAATRAPGD